MQPFHSDRTNVLTRDYVENEISVHCDTQAVGRDGSPETLQHSSHVVNAGAYAVVVFLNSGLK